MSDCFIANMDTFFIWTCSNVFLPAHDLVSKKNTAHFRILILPLIWYGLKKKEWVFFIGHMAKTASFIKKLVVVWVRHLPVWSQSQLDEHKGLVQFVHLLKDKLLIGDVFFFYLHWMEQWKRQCRPHGFFCSIVKFADFIKTLFSHQKYKTFPKLIRNLYLYGSHF